MKKAIGFLTAAALMAAFLCVSVSAAPVYSYVAVTDDDGLTDDLRYTTPSGQIDAAPGDVLLMAGGAVLPYRVLFMDDSPMLPARAVVEAFGGSADWDDSTKTARYHLGGLEIEVPAIYPAIIADNMLYVPAGSFAGILGKDCGFLNGFAPNGIVWVDDKYDDADAAWEGIFTKARYQSLCERALALLSPYQLDEDMKPFHPETSEMIQMYIEAASYVGQAGRYALFDYPYRALVSADGKAYFYKQAYLIGESEQADFNDSTTFIPMFFAD